MTVTAVHHLNCGTMCPFAGRLLGFPRLVAHVLVLETVRDGLVLVDTGFGADECARTRRLPGGFALVGAQLDPAEPAIAQLAALGFQPADVRHIAVTHLDADHAGGLSDFPKATVHVHAREHAAAHARATRVERARYHPPQWAHGVSWAVYTEDGETWRGLPAIAKLRGLDADIGLVPMHGHTRGHSAVIARHGDTWLVHAGDAYFHRREVADPPGRVPGALRGYEKLMAMDKPAMRASQAALRQLKLSYPDIRMFCAHDPEELVA